MASSGKLDISLPRLTEDNFDQWTLSLRMITLALKAEDYVFTYNATNPIDLRKLDDDGTRVFFLIANMMLNSVDQKLRSVAIAGAGKSDMYPYNIYAQLERHFNPATRSNDIQLRRQLYMMRFHSGRQTLESFANEIRMTVNKINFIADKQKLVPIGDREMITVLLMDLPPEYSTEVTMVELQPKTSFEDALEMLRGREQRLLLASGSPSSSSSSSAAGQPSGAVNSAQGERKRDLFCELHGKGGHSTEQCHKLNGDGPHNDGRAGRGRSRGRGRGQHRGNRSGLANAAARGPTVLMIMNESPDDELLEEIAVYATSLEGAAILDSGCSRHVCGRQFRDRLTGWHTGPTVSVRVANGERHTSNRYASLPLTIATDDGPMDVIFSDVLYIEEITNLLLSVGVMTDRGATFTFARDTMQMVHPAMSITVRRNADENLYRFQLLDAGVRINLAHKDLAHKELACSDPPKEEIDANLAISEQIMIHHCALGHPGRRTMIRLSKAGVIPPFRPTDVKRVIGTCESCHLAKARAGYTPKKSNHPATRPLERIHCDAVMIKHQTIGGKTGFSLIVDEFTQLVDVRLITRKNETTDHLKDFTRRMETLGYKIATIRTDSASEFAKDKDFIKWLLQNRIRQELSAPYSQFQNGIVERHIQTIEDRATAILIHSGLPKGYWGEAMLCASVTWNSTGTQAKPPYEMVTGRTPDLSLLMPFGCRVYVRHPPEFQHHMEARGEKAIFIGYSPETKGYRVIRDANPRQTIMRSL